MKRITACLLVLCLIFGLTPSARANLTAESKRSYIIVLGTDNLKNSTGLKAFVDYKSTSFDVSVTSMSDIAKQFTDISDLVEQLRQYLNTKVQAVPPYVLLIGTLQEIPMSKFYTYLYDPSFDALTDACLLYNKPLSIFDGNGNGQPGEYVEYLTDLHQQFVIGRLPTDNPNVLDTYFPLLVKEEKEYENNPALSGMVACAVVNLSKPRYNSDIIGEQIKSYLPTVAWTTLYEKEGDYVSSFSADSLNLTNFVSNWNKGLDIVFTDAHGGRWRLIFDDKNHNGVYDDGEEQYSLFWGELAELKNPVFFGYLSGCDTFTDDNWEKAYFPYVDDLLGAKLLNFVGYASVVVSQNSPSLSGVFGSIAEGYSIGDAIAIAKTKTSHKDILNSWFSVTLAGDPSARLNNKTTTVIPTPSTTSNDLVKLSWQVANPALAYNVQVSSSSDFTNIVKSDITYTTSYQLNSLPVDNYYWKVQGVYDNGEGDWSETKSFAVYEPLNLVVNSLPTQVSDHEVIVSGSTTGSRILINNQEQIITNGKFSTVITLSLGKNTIKVVAFDNHGQSMTKELVITYQALKPEMVLEFTIGVPTIWINGRATAIDAAPVITNSRTLVPLRAIFEAVGGDVGWDPSTRQITIMSRGQSLVLIIGKNTAVLNGQVVSIDSDTKVVPTITNGRTLLPLRFVAEAFGFQVDWNAEARSIVLTYSGGS